MLQCYNYMQCYGYYASLLLGVLFDSTLQSLPGRFIFLLSQYAIRKCVVLRQLSLNVFVLIEYSVLAYKR